MNHNDLYDEIETPQSTPERYFGLTWRKLLIAVGAVLILGVYIGILLFGDNSLEVLLQLEEYDAYLQDEIERLKTENASLQKEYFELKGLDADSQEE